MIFRCLVILTILSIIFVSQLLSVQKNVISSQKPLTHKIPKILHFVWIDVDINRHVTPPSEMSANIEKWKKLNPSWKVIVWSSPKINITFPDLVHEIRNYRVTAWQSDLIRYRILYEYGGLYLDTDIHPLRKLPSTIINTPFAVCQRPLAFETGQCQEVCTAVIGVPPHLPLLFELLETALWRSRMFLTFCKFCPYNTYISGPPVLSQFVLDTFRILPTHTFFPCWYRDRSKCVPANFEHNNDIIAMHTWNHSWKINSISL